MIDSPRIGIKVQIFFGFVLPFLIPRFKFFFFFCMFDIKAY